MSSHGINNDYSQLPRESEIKNYLKYHFRFTVTSAFGAHGLKNDISKLPSESEIIFQIPEGRGCDTGKKTRAHVLGEAQPVIVNHAIREHHP